MRRSTLRAGWRLASYRPGQADQATSVLEEDHGALKVKRLNDGELTDFAAIAPGSGYGFGPRHVDLDPTQRSMFVSVGQHVGNSGLIQRPGQEVRPEQRQCALSLTKRRSCPCMKLCAQGPRASHPAAVPSRQCAGGRGGFTAATVMRL